MTEINNFAQAEMAIRKPIDQVFAAFIDPEITTKFWFTKSSGKLEAGNTVHWTWEMYKVSVPVEVLEIIPNEKILIEWGTGQQRSRVAWKFNALTPTKTFVTITNYNLQSTGEALISEVRDSTGGFTIVLAGLKAWLEHDIELKLIEDKFPQELMKN